jgi:hypothetical protein
MSLFTNAILKVVSSDKPEQNLVSSSTPQTHDTPANPTPTPLAPSTPTGHHGHHGHQHHWTHVNPDMPDFPEIDPTFAKAAGYIICIIKVILAGIAVSLALHCNQMASITMRVSSVIISILMSEIYIIYYAVYHLFLGNQCFV